ncbi:MAG TPA: GNAT family N-acetyltransferase [Gammaproteobacteria bacterium]
MTDTYSISTDKSKLDIERIHAFLSNESYWAKGRSPNRVKNSIENSLCFGLYKNGHVLIGFARVVTDKTVFAFLMDVFILREYRGRGFGKMLMEHVLNYPELKTVRWLLGTEDARDFYSRLGFENARNPKKYMSRPASAED